MSTKFKSKNKTANGTKPVLAVRCYPTDDEIIKMVDDFTKDLNVSNATKRATQFGYQEGLYKMIEIWKQSNNDR